jgi:hypothetical protein
MPVINQYTDVNISGNVVNKLTRSLAQGAGNLFVGQAKFQIQASDSSGSIYRMFKNINANLIPVQLSVFNDAMAGSTNVDVQLFQPDLGVVTAATGAPGGDNIKLAAGLTLAAAHGHGAALSGLANIPVNRMDQRLFELAGETLANKISSGYDLCLVGNTLGGVAGWVTVIGLFAQG